eukprot:6171926-Pleurochrysis_carterae.AAC.2
MAHGLAGGDRRLGQSKRCAGAGLTRKSRDSRERMPAGDTAHVPQPSAAGEAGATPMCPSCSSGQNSAAHAHAHKRTPVRVYALTHTSPAHPRTSISLYAHAQDTRRHASAHACTHTHARTRMHASAHAHAQTRTHRHTGALAHAHTRSHANAYT